MKIYVASSWRNCAQPQVVKLLRSDGHEVYDFKHSEPGDSGFHWSEIDGGRETWTKEQYRAALNHPIVVRGFGKDMRALEWCDACVLVHPAGNDAHLELGLARGSGKGTAVLFPEQAIVQVNRPHTDVDRPSSSCAACRELQRHEEFTPGLMYKVADLIAIGTDELRAWLRSVEHTPGGVTQLECKRARELEYVERRTRERESAQAQPPPKPAAIGDFSLEGMQRSSRETGRDFYALVASYALSKDYDKVTMAERNKMKSRLFAYMYNGLKTNYPR